ncbi:MAG: flagellar motor switch protein FliM [Syntrophales bacterium]|nr:flagellar motor switch protein FliM [Syntrophales bacterium]
MSRILTQEEVDALLRGISGGEIETETPDLHEESDVIVYDLTSQDRIIRGRMPTLEMLNEKFARLFRTTLSSLLRKMTSVSVVSVDTMKFGEFLKTLPVPTSLHLFRMDPLRGTSLFVVEAKVIFMLVDLLFGGSGRDTYKVEGREFTAIENNIIRRIVMNAVSDLEKTWKGFTDITITYQRSEVNPQFAQIVSLTDLVVIINFEVEIEYSAGLMTICIPYIALEPLRERLHAGFQSEEMIIDRTMADRFIKNFLQAQVEVVVELGSTEVSAGDVVRLQKGDIITLDQVATDPLPVFVEGIMKFRAYAGTYKGNQAVQIAEIIEREV